MTRFLALLPVALVAVLLALAPAGAQQTSDPTKVNPTTAAVKEEALLNALQRLDGRITIPDQKAGVLIQPAGQSWRDFHQTTLPWIGAIAILGMVAVLAIFYLVRGRIPIRGGRSGRTITRFNAVERFAHWLSASTFVVLAITGLNITFGKALLLPLIGPEAFTAFSQWGKYAHNYLSFAFALGVVLILVLWIKDNIPGRIDVEWFKAGGGLVGDRHPASRRFNGGQKLIFWIVVIGGIAASVTGFLLMFPFYATGIEGMQVAQVIHAIVAVLFIAVMLGHIYIGSLGMEGAFEAMGSGEVDLNWARDHHGLWVEEQMAKGRTTPPPGAHASAAE
ncbi:MAG: formate dehydrogenase subunit gamma [Alphaproteobacteria bacterium]